MTQVFNGIDMLIRAPRRLRGRRIGIVTNPTGVTRKLTPTVDALMRIPGADVRALFGPEHGVRGDVQDALHVASGVDAASGLPVHSLYGERKRPTPQALADIDLLIYDMQDVGCRFYTYVYTLSYVMEAAAEAGIEVLVLDRPNPISGSIVEGPLLVDAMRSFIGRYPLPVRYGMTPGEFAAYINVEQSIGCTLNIVPMRGWTRAMWFDQTGLPWVTPSPNLPTPESATIYPGTCLMEGTNLSEGRGTTHPFEWLGAPWVDADGLAHALNGRQLPGLRFRPVHFVPTYGKHEGIACHGVQAHVVARRRVRAFEAGLHMVSALLQLHPRDTQFLETSWEGKPPHFDLLSGDPRIREDLLAGRPVEEIAAAGRTAAAGFAIRRRKYLLYPQT